MGRAPSYDRSVEPHPLRIEQYAESEWGEIEAVERVLDREASRKRGSELDNRRVLLGLSRSRKGYGVGIVRRAGLRLKPDVWSEISGNAEGATDGITPFSVINHTDCLFVRSRHFTGFDTVPRRECCLSPGV